jgi:hypothetical protein
MAWLISLVCALGLLVSPAWAAGPELQQKPLPQPLQRDAYLCEGDPLLAEVFAGAVDAPGIPNMAAGTPPGASVVLAWRGVSLQLPRTNNVGATSYTDGRWWWSPVDPEHPEFKERRGGVQIYGCERDGARD